MQSPDQAAARAAPPEPSLVTAPVEFRVLQATVIARGDVVAVGSTRVIGPAVPEGTAAVITGLFVSAGDEVDAGQRLLEVSGRPVFALEGPSPVYRPLVPGMTGPDVSQLQAALADGGCDANASGVYDEATERCVEAMYRDAGYEPLRTSAREATDLTAAERAVAEAGENLAAATTALDLASAPPAPDLVAAARQTVGEAERTYAAVVAEQPRLLDTAIDQVDLALAQMNAVLAGDETNGGSATNPSDGQDSASTGGAVGFQRRESSPVHGSSGASGSPERLAAAIALDDAVSGVAAATRDGANAVADAEQALNTARISLDAILALPDVSAEQLAVDQAEASLQRARESHAELKAVSGPIVSLGEVVFVNQLPARVNAVNTAVGRAAAANTTTEVEALAELVSSELHVEVSIPSRARDLVTAGMAVDLLSEATGESVAGILTLIGDRMTESATTGALGYQGVVEATIPADWSGRNLRVTFTTATTDRPVLVVPTAAIVSTEDGRTHVQVERTTTSWERIDVTTGLAADGYVVITPLDGSVTADDRVVVA